jgi:hypothetical protein
MRRVWLETVREGRWLCSRRAPIALGAVSICTAVWGAVSTASAALSAVDAFHDTVKRYRRHAMSIDDALGAPSAVTGDATHELISNPLRYDLDRAALAYAQLLPGGAAAIALSLCALIILPLVGFVLGVFLSTHDVKSGSIVFRWPQSGIVPFAVSKPLVMIGSMAALVTSTGLLAAAGSFAAEAFVRPTAAEIVPFAGAQPSLGRVVLIGSMAVLTGATSGALGMLIGSLTRNRTFTIAGFAVAYLLLPLAGEQDPRNMVARIGADVYVFAGDFRLQGAGHLPPSFAAVGLAASMVGLIALSLIPWVRRRRTERHA